MYTHKLLSYPNPIETLNYLLNQNYLVTQHWLLQRILHTNSGVRLYLKPKLNRVV